MKFLALDFDGVIADSIDECLVTAHNAYSRFQGKKRLCTDLASVPAGLVDAFRRMRPLIRRGEDYVFLIQAFEEHRALADQRHFDDYLDSNEERRNDYRQLFYAARAQLQEYTLSSWLDLNPLFPGMKRFLRGLLEPESTFVVTTKDLASVQLLFHRHGILIPEHNLFQCTRQTRKATLLNEIVDGLKTPAGNLHFIDDHVATLLEVARHCDVSCACAAWGYNTPEQIASLQDEGIAALSREAFFGRYSELTDFSRSTGA